MKIMIFLDLDNFRQSLFRKEKNRFYDFQKFPHFVIKLINKELNFQSCTDESLIRTYAYTGEYTQNLIKKIKNEKIVELFKKRMKAQQSFFELTKKFNFFELTTLPLKYEDEKTFQKGIDVRIAVDLVRHATNNNYDIAVICSGDIDLIEAIKLVKSLGKKVIIISHSEITSREIKKEADYFINIARFNNEQLNQFSKEKLK